VAKALGDWDYDIHRNFTFLAGQGVEAGIKVWESFNTSCSVAREKVMRVYHRDPPGWKEAVGSWQVLYGFKRLFRLAVTLNPGHLTNVGLRCTIYMKA
jgi:hypothetical protein